MAKIQGKNFLLSGRIAGLGVTFYQRGGKMYARIGTRSVPDRQSLKQFKTRAKMRHSIALWNCFSNPDKPLMDRGKSWGCYNAFLGANAHLPTVYLPKAWAARGAALLIDGMVVSSGRLPEVKYDFATLAGGGRVVLTNLSTGMAADVVQPLAIGSEADMWGLLMSPSRNPQLMPGDRLRIYRLEQQVREGCPWVGVTCLDLCLEEDLRPKPWLADWQFLSVDGFLAIGGADDENVGWAVVLYGKDEQNASPQQVLSSCQLYRRYTTEEALTAAAESYGNVKMPDFLTPNARERKYKQD
ncbi:MAG: hypothetical protein IJM33_03490 [Bacteroidales bacterium]|nr:hypothetical protein [Bacteroidales bacterium]